MQRPLLIEYLERRRARFFRETHRVAYTAADVAETSHINCHNFAKVVMVKVDGELVMTVLPAHCYLNLELMKQDLGVEQLELAREREFDYRFPRCESGAMPPFGHLFGFRTYLVPLFDESGEIAFSAGSHSEIIRMPMREYLQLAYVDEVSPQVAGSASLPLVPDHAYSLLLKAGTASLA